MILTDGRVYLKPDLAQCRCYNPRNPTTFPAQPLPYQDTHKLDAFLPPRAMEGVKALDLGIGIPPANATRLLGCFGAEVIKVEPSHGDPLRMSGPFLGDIPNPETSGLFQYLNVNKKGITLNLESGRGRRVLKDLLRWADMVVEGRGAGVMDGLGLTYEEMERVNPALVAVSITPFGQSGPYKDYKSYEIQPYAFGGPMYFTGNPEREPVNAANNVSDLHTGLAAATAGMVAFHRAEATGEGDYIDIAAAEVQLGNIDRRAAKLLAYSYTGTVGDRNLDHMGIGSGPFPCSDGYINLLGGEFGFDRVCRLIEREDLMEDPRFNTPEGRRDPANIEEISGIIISWLYGKQKLEAWEIAQQKRVLSGVVNTTEDLLSDGHFWERGMWAQVKHPIAGEMTMPGKSLKMYRTPWQVKSAAPTLGQHNEEVYCGMLGYGREELSKLRQAGVI